MTPFVTRMPLSAKRGVAVYHRLRESPGILRILGIFPGLHRFALWEV
jgi:hypothetical protein